MYKKVLIKLKWRTRTHDLQWSRQTRYDYRYATQANKTQRNYFIVANNIGISIVKKKKSKNILIYENITTKLKDLGF